MRLYLVQHGKATSKDKDPERPLTPEGREEAQKVVRFLRPLRLAIEQIWHSGKTRARQTAEALAARLGSAPKVSARDGLSPKDPPGPIREAIARLDNDLLIAGHMPFMGRLAGLLLCDDADRRPVAFEMGGVVCLERGAGMTWSATWIVTPALLRSQG